MTTSTILCEYPGCAWESRDGELETIVKLLEIHVRCVHMKENSCMATTGQAKRPEIVQGMSEEAWKYFLYRWQCYKKLTRLQGEDIVLELMDCCCEQVRRDHYRIFTSAGAGETESEVLDELKDLSVMARNMVVNRVKLTNMKQKMGEPIQIFASRVQSEVVKCGFSVPCQGCNMTISYAEEAVLDQVGLPS